MTYPGKRLTLTLYRQALCAQSIAYTALIDAASRLAFRATGFPMHPCSPWAVSLAIFGLTDVIALMMDRNEEHHHE